jgi:hypothetical protein
LRVLISRVGARETRLMSMRFSGGKRGAMDLRKAVRAMRVGVVVGRSLRKRRSLPLGGGLGCRPIETGDVWGFNGSPPSAILMTTPRLSMLSAVPLARMLLV